MLAIISALALALPGAAIGSNSQEMVLQDDSQLLYSTPTHAAQVLQALRALGVDRVRVSVVWSLLAPSPNSSRRPRFNAANPAAYPAGSWSRYDFLDRVAHQFGIQIYFQPTAPAPTWATTPRLLPQGYRWSHNPNAQQFGQFVQAIGQRYSGHYLSTDFTGRQSPLPAVTYWGIWNEPNIGGWMTPQWNKLANGQKVEAAPAIYRGMVNAAWQGLVNTGHRHDTVLIGETAAYGAGHEGYGASMDPLTFVRAFYCLDSSYRPVTGSRATNIGCPASGSRSAFVRSNPALFQAPGWAHHPYDFDNAPGLLRANPNSSTLSSLGRIETALDRSRQAYQQPAGIPIYITEWGVQSNPPNPFVKFSEAQQAEYLNQGEYMAWRDSRVRAFAQFLLVDDAPYTQYAKGSRAYWSTFDSGLLLYPHNAPKPSYYAFELPIWLPSPAHGTSVPVWLQIRPNDAPRQGTLQFQATGSQTWSTVAQVQATGAEGFVFTHVSLPSGGGLRLKWTGPRGVVWYSRTAQVN